MNGTQVTRLIKRHPVLSYGVFVLVLGIGINALGALGHGYDDQSFGTASFLLATIWAVLGFPFFLASEGLAAARGGHALPADTYLSIVVGLAFFLAVDLLWTAMRSRRCRPSS